MGVPLIGVGVPHNEGSTATVSIDNAKSMRMAINHLHAGAPAYRLHLHRRLGGADGIQCGLAPAEIRTGLCGV